MMKLPEEILKAGFQTQDLSEDSTVYGFGPFLLNPAARTLNGPAGPVPLTPKEIATLCVLARNGGKPVSAQTLLEAVWSNTSVDKNNVSQLIHRLRRKLAANDSGQDHIPNWHNIGYRLAATVTTQPAEARPASRVSDALESETVVQPAGHTVPSEPSRRLLYAVILLLVVLLLGLSLYIYLQLRARPEALLVTRTEQLTDDGLPKRGPMLFDGKRIWLQEELAGEWRIVSVAAAGGDAVPLDLPLKGVALRDVAADGSALLISADGDRGTTLWSWPLTGGAPQMLPPQTGDAAWAPDQRTIAFGSWNALVLSTGTAPPVSTTMPPLTVLREPRWSPGGERLTVRLTYQKSGLSRLWLFDRRGARDRPVPGTAETGEDQLRGIWTRDGRYYLFAGGSVTKHDLWAVRGHEGFFSSRFAKPWRLTHGPGSWDWPTPGRATDELYAMGETIKGKLMGLPRSGSEWRPYLGGIAAYELDFSRDRKWVAYVHYPDHTLWKAKSDGSQPMQLTSSTDVEAHQPHWSPDGNRIAYMGQRPGQPWRVMIWNLGGQIEEPLPSGPDQGVPTWSPDGRHLLYGEWPSGKNTPMRLHLLDLVARRADPMEGSDGLWTSRWSADGAYICALRQDSGSLMLNRAGESSWREIVSGMALDNVTWSFDSKYVYLTAHLSSLLRVNVLKGQVESLADVHAISLAHEAWFGVAPDGSALTLQGVPKQEIYALRWVLP